MNLIYSANQSGNKEFHHSTQISYNLHDELDGQQEKIPSLHQIKTCQIVSNKKKQRFLAEAVQNPPQSFFDSKKPSLKNNRISWKRLAFCFLFLNGPLLVWKTMPRKPT